MNIPADDNSINARQKRVNYYELLLSVGLFAVITAWAIWPVLSAGNDVYPITTDGLGHLTRIHYIAECLQQGNWPGWFPYWYCGSTVMQYYPPLSFLLAALIQIATNNIMATYGLFIFACQLIGAIGIWLYCNRFIGRWAGLIGGTLYALQPFLLRTLVLQGALAQGPIFALTPWFFYFSMVYFSHRTRKSWLLTTLFSTLLMLSQPMHFYLIGICMGIVGLVLLLQKEVQILDLFIWGLALVMGIGIGACWALPGVTHLENPAVPYLLPEVSVIWSAKWNWFLPSERLQGGWYPSLAMFITSCFSLVLIKNDKYKRFILAFFVAMVLATCFSLGNKFFMFRFLPLNNTIVTMRFLSFSVMIASILIAYITTYLLSSEKKHVLIVIGQRLLAAVILVFIAIDINPMNMPISMNNLTDLKNLLGEISNEKGPFEQGRFAWVYEVPTHIAYIPMIVGLNMTDGWNIEGTPHNREIWQHNIAIPKGCSNYVVRNLLIWNSRSIYVDLRYKGVIKGLLANGFHIAEQDQYKAILLDSAASSYFMIQQRDALVIGKAARTLEMNFPWMVKGYSNCLEEYPAEYFKHFKLIYIIEPEVKDFERFEARLAELAAQDKTVIISQGRGEAWPILDIIPYWEVIETPADLTPSPDSPLKGKARIEADPTGRAPAIGNADILWAITQESDKKIPAIGYKTVDGHRVYFVGLSLGQQLNGSHGREIKNILEQLLDISHPNKSIVPVAFPVENTEWRHDGFSFNYNAGEKETLPMQISVTYSPRWRAMVDGKPWRVYNMENLIYMELPPGQHKVSFQYGMTWVGWLGIALSILSLIILVLIYKFFYIFDVIWQALKTKSIELITELGQ